MTVSAGASAGHYGIHSLGGFHQLKQRQGNRTEITVSWAQLTPAGRLPAATRREELWFSTETKRSSLGGRRATASLVPTRQETGAGPPGTGSRLKTTRLQIGRETYLSTFQNKHTCCRGVTVQREACCKHKAPWHTKRVWMLVLPEATANLCPGRHVTVLEWQLLNPHRS